MPAPQIRLLLLLLFAALVLLVYTVQDDWGGPLGESYAGPEGQPRPLAAVTGDLSADERATIAVFERASRSVVFITNSAIRRTPWSLNAVEVPQGSGSGIVWNKQGHIVTNFHVIYGADAISVITVDGSDHEGRVVGIDPDDDLAVLQIRAPEKELTPIDIGTSQGLRVGQKVLAIGNPFGLDHTLTTGVVSALGRTIKSITNRTIEGVIQTDAAINPGNSGGPLLDRFGRLVGINTAIQSPSGVFAGVGFAVPVDTVNRIVPQLIRHGRVIRPGLGVSLIQDAVARQWGIKGVVIGQVSRNSAAAQAGLQGVREAGFGRIELGDVIIKLDGQPIEVVDDLLRILDRHKVGDQVELEYLRDGHRDQVTVTLQAVN
jgi:S1-C subfamily serine protease